MKPNYSSVVAVCKKKWLPQKNGAHQYCSKTKIHKLTIWLILNSD